ncbi:MAG: 2'-5' RNA ligase family protein [Chitinophagaceae bacterium]|nr:MAG: 2'-5' RNA ligase family protein [Chitinophagaceae bacterium]
MIITIILDEQSKTYFNELRTKHFPAELNYLDAHLTLFHNVPDEGWVHKILSESSKFPGFEMQISGLMHTGFGVAYKIESPELIALHKNLSENFKDVLIPQDRQKFRPHITVQNKVSAVESKALHKQLTSTFTPSTITALGVSCYRYLNGPWEPLADFHFTGTGGLIQQPK